MLSDSALERVYELVGIAGDDPSSRGRQRRLRAALEAAYPEIRSSIAAEVADLVAADGDYACGGFEIDAADWIREQFAC